MAAKDISWKAIIWSAVIFHIALAFHNYCGVDGANYFSAYSQYAFGIPAARHNYFSALFSCAAIFHLLSRCLFIPLTVSIKLINAFCWISCSYMISRRLCDHNRSSSRWWFVCLAFNPIAIFDIHYHVQHDAIALFLMVLGLILYEQPRDSSKIAAGLSWAIAASMKVYPLFLLPLFIFDRRHPLKDKLAFYGSSAFFLLVPEIPWICRIGWSETFLKALSYKSFNRFGLYRVVVAQTGSPGAAHWAVERLFQVLDEHAAIVVGGMILIAGLLVYFRGVRLFRAMGLCFALILLVCTKNTPQALMLVVPFLVSFRGKAALIFANAAYALVLAFFYLLDIEMNGSYCLLKTLSGCSISRDAIAFWERALPAVSLYLWGWTYLLASFAFVYGYRPVSEEADVAGNLAYKPGMNRVVWKALIAIWLLSFLSVPFPGNPFTRNGGGLPPVVLCNTVLQPASTVEWYGSKGEYDLQFNGLQPGDTIRISGDSYFTTEAGGQRAGPFRGDGNKLYSFWWGVSQTLSYDQLQRAGFRVLVSNQLCSIRGINTITAKLTGPGEEWWTPGHRLEGKVEVLGCRIDGKNYDAELGDREGRWLAISPKNFRREGRPALNIFDIILLYIAAFLTVIAAKLKMAPPRKFD